MVKFIIAFALASVLLFSAEARSVTLNCSEIERQAQQFQTLIPGAESGTVVIGKEPLAVFSAPDSACKQPSVSLREGDNLDSYDEYNGYTSVLFIDLKTGSEITGWVHSERIRKTGFGISPN